MWGINLIILIIFIIFYFISRKHLPKGVNKKENRLFFLYSMAGFILKMWNKNHSFGTSGKKTVKLKALYVGKEITEVYYLYLCKKIALMIGIFLLFTVFSLFIELKESNLKEIINNSYIVRPLHGEGTKEVSVMAELRDKKEIIKKEIVLTIDEVQYKEKEWLELVEKAQKEIDKNILSNNSSYEEIKYPLYLMKQIPNTGIKISWDLGLEGLVKKDGTLQNEEVLEGGMLTTISAIFTYGKKKVEYPITLRIMPKELEVDELLAKELERALNDADNSSKELEFYPLPSKAGEYKTSFSEKSSHNGMIFLCVGVFSSLLAGVYLEQGLEKQMKKREFQMMLDYPEIINKFTLLLGAGMTIKSAWGRIVKEYCEKKEKRAGRHRYAYEEMNVTWHELKNGVVENQAFESFGKRVKLLPYLKFSSLLCQNIRKGSKNLIELLEIEGMEAFEERKELAKRLGEEAGTKLLFPMILMLLLVLGIIMIPAFLSFS